MAILKQGSTGEIVRRLQDTIDAPIDGSFGLATEKKLKAWQKANGFKVDGIAGPDIQHEMGLSDLVGLEPGDSGDLVTLLRERLGIAAGKSYDDVTGAAVRAWQMANGLKATGVADPATLAAMKFFEDDGESNAKPTPAAVAPSASPALAPSNPQPASGGGLSSWAYQLNGIDPEVIAGLPVDLAVVDYAREGDQATAFKPAEVARMQQRPGGGAKKIIAYMSIGEAESYRFYWQKAWSDAATKPAWLDDENPDWPENFKVRYWDPQWQAIILGSRTSYLDRILAAGFDGVYLDIIDAFEYWRDVKGDVPDADTRMIAFVTKIAAYARARRPGFLIVPQNGEALLADPAYRAVVSAQAKEDLLYGLDGDGRANRKADVKECMESIAPAAAGGLPILVVEYLDDARKRADARDKLSQQGFAVCFAPRDLSEVPADQFDA